MSSQKLRSIRALNWRKATGWLFLLIVVFTAYSWKLSSLPSGLSSFDQVELSSSSSLGQIADAPVFAPHKLLLYGTTKIWPHSVWAARLPSLLVTALVLISIFYILQKWFGRTIGTLATLMATFLPWLLVAGRQVEPLVMYFSPVLIGALLLALSKSSHRNILLVLLSISVVWCLYVPGMILLFLILLASRGRSFWQILSTASTKIKLTGLVLLVAGATPAIKSLISNWGVNKVLLGLPQHLPTPLVFLKNLAWSVLALAWRTPYHEPWLLGRLPALNIIMVVLAGFGVYAMIKLARPKAELLILYSVITVLLAAFNSSIQMIMLVLPALMVFVAAGLRYLYFEWSSVFPLNPIPRTTAVLLIGLVGIMSMLYGVRSTLVAWPHNSETQASYHATIRF